MWSRALLWGGNEARFAVVGDGLPLFAVVDEKMKQKAEGFGEGGVIREEEPDLNH